MIKRDLNVFKYIMQNPGHNNKSFIDRDYLTLKDNYKISNCNCNCIAQLIMLGYEYDDEYIVPEYQRELVWNLEQKQELVKSIFYGNPIGDFLFKQEFGKDERGRRNTLNVMYSIIDGQQRVNAIREFFTNKFEVDGKFFKEHKYWDVRKFLFDYQINVIGIQDISLEQEIEIYLKRNVGGTTHTKEEINKAKEFMSNINNKEIRLSENSVIDIRDIN